MGTHKNTTKSRNFAVNLIELNVIPGFELVLWKNILLKKYVQFYIKCGNLMVNVDQQHNVQRLNQKKQCLDNHKSQDNAHNTQVAFSSRVSR